MSPSKSMLQQLLGSCEFLKKNSYCISYKEKKKDFVSPRDEFFEN